MHNSPPFPPSPSPPLHLSLLLLYSRLHLALFYLGPRGARVPFANVPALSNFFALLLSLNNSHHISARLSGSSHVLAEPDGTSVRRPPSLSPPRPQRVLVTRTRIEGTSVVSRSSRIAVYTPPSPPPLPPPDAPLRPLAVLTFLECAVGVAKAAATAATNAAADRSAERELFRRRSRRRLGGGSGSEGRDGAEGEEEEEEEKAEEERGNPLVASGGRRSTPFSRNGTPPPACVVCMSPRSVPTFLPCGHVFCWDCIMKWIGRTGYCPTCRVPAMMKDVNVLEAYD